MIQPATQTSALFGIVGTQNRSASEPTSRQMTTAININNLFSPSELRTIGNMKASAVANGASEMDARDVEIILMTARLGDPNIPMKEVLGNQIRGIQEGNASAEHEKNMPSLSLLQYLHNNLESFKGLSLEA